MSPPVDAIRRFALGRVYSIGILRGPSPLALAPAANLANPVLAPESLPGLLVTSVADPFMIRVDGTWYMFFEAVNWTPGSKKGEIAFATSRDGERWAYQRIVLSEPFHLSYPYVFEWKSDYYMIPESTAAGAVRLYRAERFPDRWTLAAELLRGPVFLDSSVFHRENRWWMFTATDASRGTLRLLRAADLAGPWLEHPKSPVVAADLRIARPAGRVLSTPARLIRFAQDCRAAYGTAVHAFEVTCLTPSDYAERELAPSPLLAGSGHGWNGSGMHHVDAHLLEDGSWIACADGWSTRVRRPREIVRWAADRLRTIARGERATHAGTRDATRGEPRPASRRRR
jgi:hypothetical protein